MDFTFGVEEEYQVVEPGSGMLRSRARDVLALDWADELRKELQETTVEIGTAICTSAEEVHRELARLRFHVATVAAGHDLAIAACGTHPFSRWQGHLRTDDERYERIEQQYGLIAKDEHNFGMHVHVAVPQGVDRIALLGEVRAFAPHLTALAASSPYYEGQDTYFSSYRMVL
ncbi:MAG TPA: glutamate-cysteine ligase family protein, partial [Longimicrobiales bacterium]